MRHVDELLGELPVAKASGASEPSPLGGCDRDLLHVLGAGLPAGHLHVWGGAAGSGKTSFLLCLLHGAASQGRTAAYATYDLSAATLAARMLAMGSGLPADRLREGTLDADAALKAARVRSSLAALPLWFLEARGLGVPSLEDRLARMPHRAEVLAVDYLQAVVREPSADLGQTLRDLSTLASRLHVAVICALRSEPGTAQSGLEGWEAVEAAFRPDGAKPDRVGWIARATGSDARRAEVLRNRYGERPSLPLRFDPATGRVERAD